MFTQNKRHEEKRENTAAIDTLKTRIRTEGGDIDEKEVNKIMSTGSQMGLDPKKGEKTKSKTKVLDKIKGKVKDLEKKDSKSVPFGKAKKGESGREGSGRFNREFAMEREKRMSGMTDKEFDRHKTNTGFKSSKDDRGSAPIARGRGGGRGGGSRGGSPSRGGSSRGGSRGGGPKGGSSRGGAGSSASISSRGSSRGGRGGRGGSSRGGRGGGRGGSSRGGSSRGGSSRGGSSRGGGSRGGGRGGRGGGRGGKGRK